MLEDASQIKKILEEMKLFNKPEELEKIRSLIRKNVPLSMRGYLLAYLYMKSNGRTGQQSQRKPVRTEGMVSLYVSVGKNSGTTARELIQFLAEKSGINPGQIYEIIMKPGYSFANTDKESAVKIIEEANGAEFRGKKLKINYSNDRPKDGSVANNSNRTRNTRTTGKPEKE